MMIRARRMQRSNPTMSKRNSFATLYEDSKSRSRGVSGPILVAFLLPGPIEFRQYPRSKNVTDSI